MATQVSSILIHLRALIKIGIYEYFAIYIPEIMKKQAASKYGINSNIANIVCGLSFTCQIKQSEKSKN